MCTNESEKNEKKEIVVQIRNDFSFNTCEGGERLINSYKYII